MEWIAIAAGLVVSSGVLCAGDALAPGSGTMMSAHNCYPYGGLWADRMDRALAAGRPVAVEQDLCWVVDEVTGVGRSVVAHNGPFRGDEPSLDDWFFGRVKEEVEAAIERAQVDRRETATWPLVVLDLDIKDWDETHLRVIRSSLEAHAGWLTTAERGSTVTDVAPLRPGPVMVLIGGGELAMKIFHDEIPLGGELIAFGRCIVEEPSVQGLEKGAVDEARVRFPAQSMVTEPADNFRRWWNSSWDVVEAGGPKNAGAWTDDEDRRLREICDHAHRLGYFLRLYAINGLTPAQSASLGVNHGYSVGSREAAEVRWRAMIDAGVDFVATDDYEAFAAVLRSTAADAPVKGP